MTSRVALAILGLSLLSACEPSGRDLARANQSPDSLDYANVQAATDMFRHGQHGAAIQKIEDVLDAHPRYAEGMLVAGAMHERRGNQREAQDWYRRAVIVLRKRVSEPERWPIAQEANLAFALYLAGDQDEAVKLMEEEKNLRPDWPSTEALGQIIRSNNRESALQMLAPQGNT